MFSGRVETNVSEFYSECIKKGKVRLQSTRNNLYM